MLIACKHDGQVATGTLMRCIMQLIDASLFLSPVGKFQTSVLVSDESDGVGGAYHFRSELDRYKERIVKNR